jgi:hypothetical protein
VPVVLCRSWLLVCQRVERLIEGESSDSLSWGSAVVIAGVQSLDEGQQARKAEKA